jgi:hypothetical protein
MIHLLLYDPVKHKSDILYILHTMQSTANHLPTNNLIYLLIQCALKWKDVDKAKAWYDDLVIRKEPVLVNV